MQGRAGGAGRPGRWASGFRTIAWQLALLSKLSRTSHSSCWTCLHRPLDRQLVADVYQSAACSVEAATEALLGMAEQASSVRAVSVPAGEFLAKLGR